MLAPALVDDAQHHLALDLPQHVGAEFLLAPLVVHRRIGHHHLVDLVGVGGVLELPDRDRVRPERAEFLGEPLEIPLVVGDGGAVGSDQRVDRLGEIVHRSDAQVFTVEDLIAALVDHLALLVHHLVVLEDVLADLGVLGLDGGLGPLDRLGDHLRLDRLVVGQRASHDVVEGTGGEEPHQVVVETEEEPALAGISLAARATAQLVVDATAVVALGSDDVEPPEFADLIALGLAFGRELGEQVLVAGERLLAVLEELLGHLVERHRELEFVGEQALVETFLRDLVSCESLGVSAEKDVDTAAGHVRRHRDASQTAGLRDDLGLTGVLLRVEHLVGDAPLGEQPAEDLAASDAGRADEDRLPGFVARLDVVDDRVELGLLGLVDQVGLVEALERPVRRDGHDAEPVGVHQFGGLGLGGAGHPGELAVHPEVVLERDRGEGLVLLFDLHALLRLDRLVDALGPATPLEDASGELVDDLHLAALHDVVLVALVDLLGLQRDRELVHEV